MSARSKPPAAKTRDKGNQLKVKNDKTTGAKSLPEKCKPDQSENVTKEYGKAELLAALKTCWNKKKIKALQILEKNPQGGTIIAVDEKSYKCVLLSASTIEALINREENDGTNHGEQGNSDLSQKIETLTKEKDLIQKGLLKINTRWKQLWNSLCDATSNSPKENCDAKDVMKTLPQEMDNLQIQLRGEKEKRAKETNERIDELKQEIETLKMATQHESGQSQELIEAIDRQRNENNQMKAGVLSPTQLSVHLADEVGKPKDELVAAKVKSASSHEKDRSKVKGELEDERKIKEHEGKIKELETILQDKSREIEGYKIKIEKLQEDLKEQPSRLQLAEKAQIGSSEQEDVNGSNKEIQRLSKELEKMQNLLEGEKDSKNIFKNKEEKYKSDLNEQKQTIEKLEKQQGQLSAEKKSIEKEKHDLTRELKQRTDKWKSAENGIKNLENEVKRLEEHIKVQKAGDEMKFLREQVKSLTDRLATEMNSKISADESALENISIGNRPMKLADDYHHFCSDIWLDAKQFLDDQSMEQEHAIVLLKDILMISERECVEAAKNVNVILMQLLTEPVKKTFAVAKEKEIAPAIPETVRAVFNGVGDYLRKTADKVNLMAICEVVPKKVPKKSSVLNSKEMEKYIAESVRLSWKMVIQRPAMTFSTEGEGKKWEGEQTQELYWGSKPDNKKAVVKYYIHPKLKHGDKLMVKGRVLVE